MMVPISTYSNTCR